MGYVPCNMVSEVQYDVENDPRFRNNPNDPWGHWTIRRMVALYDYDPQELSPNPDSEASKILHIFWFILFDALDQNLIKHFFCFVQ